MRPSVAVAAVVFLICFLVAAVAFAASSAESAIGAVGILLEGQEQWHWSMVVDLCCVLIIGATFVAQTIFPPIVRLVTAFVATVLEAAGLNPQRIDAITADELSELPSGLKAIGLLAVMFGVSRVLVAATV